jgi:hypothetical protein
VGKRRRTVDNSCSADWWEPFHPCEGIMGAFPGLRHLTDRQLAVLAFTGVSVTTDEALRARQQVTVDISQSFRASVSDQGSSCIVTPSGEVFLYHRLRSALGREAMLLQGLHYGPDHHKLDAFSSDELYSLAGNAFNAYCLTATLLVKEVILAVCEERSRAWLPKLPRQPGSPELELEDDESQLLWS